MTDPLALIDSFYAAFNNRDWEAYDKHFAADGITRAAGGVEAHGVAAVVDFDKAWATAFPDAHITSLRKTAAGGAIIASENRFSGTHKGPMQTAEGEVSATGRFVEIPYVTVFEVADDKVKAQYIYYDRLDLQAQLGAD